MKYIALFSILFFSCNAQNNNKLLSLKDYDIINTFFDNISDHSYLNVNFQQKAFPKKFHLNYNQLKRLYKTADSICVFDKDTLNLKTFCPIADSYRKYINLFTVRDFDYLQKKYPNDFKSIETLDFEKIKSPLVSEHSKDYYDFISKKLLKIKEEEKYNEYPSISILGVFYTEDKNTAILYFEKKNSVLGGIYLYQVFKKQKNIWWKPIGGIKL